MADRYNIFSLGRFGLSLSGRAEDHDYIGNYEFKNGRVHRVNTPYGYMAMGMFFTYLRDYQGNNRNHASYYAYGLPVQGSEVKDPDPYLYSGKEFYSLKGVNLYDFNARTYAPDIARFMQPDPLADDYHWLSPYSYCAGDPINRVDRDGKDWTDINGNKIEDLTKIKQYIFYTNEFTDQAKVQYNDDAVKEYGKDAVAVRNTGTKEGFAKDWRAMDGDISDVIIMAHGKNQSINVTNIDGDANNQLTSTGDGRTNKSNTHATNIQDLGVPEGNINNATLYLYTCHSADTRPDAHGEQGALTGSKQTVSQSFSQNYDFRFVVSTTGSVNYYGINSSLGLIWLSLLPTIMLFWLRCKIINK